MIGILFSLPCIAVAGYLAWNRSVHAAAWIIICLPLFLVRWNSIGLPINTLDILIAVAVTIWFLTHKAEVRTQFTEHKKISLILIGWVAIACVSVIISPNTITALGILKSYFILPVMFTMFMLYTTKQIDDVHLLIKALLILVLYLSCLGLVQIIIPEGVVGFNAIENPVWRDPVTFRITSILGYPNALGLLIAPLIPFIALGYSMFQKQYEKILALTTICLGFSAILFAKSKGALIALIAAVIVAALYSYRNRLRIIIGAALLLLLLILPYSNVIVSKAGLSSYSAQLRIIQWKETVTLLTAHPIVGAGLAGYQHAIAQYHKTDFLEIFLYPHNIFLNAWVELGLLGLFYFIVLLLVAYRANFHLRTTASKFALAGITSLTIVIVHGLVDVPYFKNDLAIIFLFICIWPFLISNLKERQQQ